MLLVQFIVLVLSAAKRFDTVVLHARESVRDFLGAIRVADEKGLAD